MPVLHFQCPHCAGVFQVEPSLTEQQVACPSCQGVVAIAAVEPPEPVPTEELTTVAISARSPVSLTFPAPPPLPHKEGAGGKASGGTPTDIKASSETSATLSTIGSLASPEPTASSGIIAPAGELLGCPRCSGTFQVTADMAGQKMACPHCGGAMTIPGAAVMEGRQGDAPPIIVAAGEGDALLAFRVQDVNKKIVLGDRVVEVRRLTPDEKARRRLVKRVVLIGFCTIVLIGAMLYLNYVGLRR